MANNEPLRPLFQNERGEAAGFFLHPSIKNGYQRQNLTDYITNNGGEVMDTARHADTVLVDEKNLKHPIQIIQTAYSIKRDMAFHNITVEPMKFVQICIRNNSFIHRTKQRQGMGGYIGGMRTPFSEEDDRDLCWYLSRRIPDFEDGGRLSTGVYKELCAAASIDKALAWGNRHTPSSWLERYRKNRERLDLLIEEYVRKDPPRPAELYGFSRLCNQNPKRAYRFAQPDKDVIELIDESVHESGESDVDVNPQMRIRSPDEAGPSKRRRIDDWEMSSPEVITSAHKAARLPLSSPIRSRIGSSLKDRQGRGVHEGAPRQHVDLRDPADFSPAPENSEIEFSGPHQSSRSPAVSEDEYLIPAPSPTLVQRRNSVVRSQGPPLAALASDRRIDPAMPSTPNPTTSFRSVVHSSPIFTGPGPPRRSGIRSHDTSATEPSSRSVVVPPEQPSSMPTAASAPAESSITRESSHKRSSPITQPMRKGSRGLPMRQSSNQIDESEDDEQQREAQWAPYRNTRSRSKSIEPTSLPRTNRKRIGKNLPRNDQLLEPVHEGEVEHEQELHGVDQTVTGNQVHLTVTETMQEEQKVADLLILNADDSGTLSGISNKTAEGSGEDTGEEDTEDETQGVKRFIGRKEEEEEEYEEYESITGERQEGRVPTAVVGSGANRLEENAQAISSDDEATRRQFLSRPSAARKIASKPQRQTPHTSEGEDDGDSEISQIFTSPNTAQDTPVKTAKEVLAAFGNSPEFGIDFGAQQQHQGKRFSGYHNGSPKPRNIASREAPTQLLPSQRSTQVRARISAGPSAGGSSINQSQNLTGPHRISFGGPESSPSSVGTLPRTPRDAIVQRAIGSRSSQVPSSRASVTRPRLQQLRGKSRPRSIESTSSELQDTFPTPGTRAHAEKRKMEEDLKESPYQPPSGTKAARFVAVQESAAERTLRPRK